MRAGARKAITTDTTLRGLASTVSARSKESALWGNRGFWTTSADTDFRIYRDFRN
jgi:hypothetical protein